MAGAGSKNALSIAPTINTSAVVDDFQLGQWTEVCLLYTSDAADE